MTIKKHAENTMETLADNDQSVKEFIVALIDEASFRAKQARSGADDYTLEELDYWDDVAYEVAVLRGKLK